MKAAIIPISGTCLSPSDLFVREIAIPSRAMVINQQKAETSRLRKPSGMCIGAGE
jgi:hypothetical protein